MTRLPSCGGSPRVPRVGRLRRVLAVLTVGAALAVPAALPPAAFGGTVPPVPTGTVRPAAAPLPPARPVRVRAVDAGLDSTLIPLGLTPAGTLAVPPDGAAAGWYTGGPVPGSPGPAVLTAHVDWNHELGPFARIDRLVPGELVTVDRADGRTATFEVQAVRRYPKNHFPTAAVYGDLPRAGLRLITCGGSFDHGRRSYVDNVVVYAAMVDPVPGSA